MACFLLVAETPSHLRILCRLGLGRSLICLSLLGCNAFHVRILIYNCCFKVLVGFWYTAYFGGQNKILIFRLTFTKHYGYYAQQFLGGHPKSRRFFNYMIFSKGTANGKWDDIAESCG